MFEYFEPLRLLNPYKAHEPPGTVEARELAPKPEEEARPALSPPGSRLQLSGFYSRTLTCINTCTACSLPKAVARVSGSAGLLGARASGSTRIAATEGTGFRHCLLFVSTLILVLHVSCDCGSGYDCNDYDY